MIALMYPFKMDKNITTEMSNLYTEVYKNFNPNKPDPKQVAAQAKQEQNRQQSNDPSGMKNRNIGGAGGDKNMMKNSFEPEGEMVDEMSHKAPRKQKGAMAYDGPNKERSEAADRVLAKTKKKMKKEESDYNYVNSYLSELSKKTMGSYIAKGAKDLADRRFDQGDSEKRKYEPDEEDEKEDKKLDKREEGIARAAKKITKEGRYRAEWEEMKLKEINDHRAKFDEWTESIVEEGYDIERWSDEELIDTFIDENGLWQSREGVLRALLSESDKKGKGSGKKDACYKKVKASAKVWPSAYASGRLVQCRKKGAANYGNKSEEMSDWRSEFIWEDEVKEGIVGGAVGVHIAKNHSYPARAGKLAVKNTGNKPAV